MSLNYYKSAFFTLLGVLLPIVVLAQDAILEPPFGAKDGSSQQEPILIVATIIQVLLGFVGATTLLVFVWGGYHMIFSGGVEEKINKGRSTMLWAVIGLALILSSYAILQYVFNVFKIAAGGTITP